MLKRSTREVERWGKELAWNPENTAAGFLGVR